MASLHKPRRKANRSSFSAPINPQDVRTTSEQAPEFPLEAFLWPAKPSTSQWILLPLTLMSVGLFRWTAGFWGYSGFRTPPMHGDFEAQRHWMEITTHLPISQWYFYDLEYWGLDYPPLTAYHSWLLGKIGSIINPAWFSLFSSRGFEDQLLKVYMRATVLISEYLIYIPAAIILIRNLSRLRGVNKWKSSVALVAILMQPSTILIDHAHFQYNTVMLGFVLASISSMLAGRSLWGCVFFVAALSFKQMALYYAPAIFAYLLGSCLAPRLDLRRLVAIAGVTTISFTVMYGPLLLGALYDNYRGISPTPNLKTPPLPSYLSYLPITLDTKAFYYPLLLQVTQSLHRIFPFARGLFEDKVANVWCVIHTVHKLNRYSIPLLQRASLTATFISILPTLITISYIPRRELLPWAMASTAWGFYLCSFQVHEKSVLLPLLPMTALLGGEAGLGIEIRAWVGWANLLGCWTLFPLLKKDELRVPYFVLSLLWAYLLALPPTSLSLYFGRQSRKGGLSMPIKTLHLGFYVAMVAWHFVEAFVEPPQGKPDLWVVLNCIIGAAGFAACLLWCSWQLIMRSGVMDEYFGFRMRVDSEKKNERKKRQ